jgi:8-oxo-dGTP pyrophosphatase MutT (NUDIX family)
LPITPRTPKLQAVYANEALPSSFATSVFLAGPRSVVAGAWRQEALRLLSARSFDGVVLIPEPRHESASVSTDAANSWEDEALRHCDLILMWFPAEAYLDFPTVEQWGQWQRSGKVVLGTPLREGPLVRSAERRRVPVAHSLPELVALGHQFCRPGAHRRGGERSVPLSLWKSPSFQSWFKALHQAGHRLEGIELEWAHRARGVGRPPFLWAIRPRVLVRGERRQLAGEVVIGRADVSATVLYYRPAGLPLLDTLVVLVREFRAAVRNRGGFALMLPSGSAARAGEHVHDPRNTAAQEVLEETGLRLHPEEFVPVPSGDRQLLSSLSSHHAQLFRYELHESQLAALRETAAAGKPIGATPSERCYVSIHRLGELLGNPDVDWSHLGMLLYALLDI